MTTDDSLSDCKLATFAEEQDAAPIHFGNANNGGKMRISSIRIKNLRSFADVTVPFNDYTCLVGPNGSGKSTVLCALNIFFRETTNSSTDLVQLDCEDFHQKNTDEPIEITVTFEGLSQEAQEEFADYYRQGKLVVSATATFDPRENKAHVKQYGQRLGMQEFMKFFSAVGDGKRVPELREIYSSLRDDFPDLPAPGTKDAMIEALRKYESARPDQLSLIPSEDQFYGVSRGANRLARYLQWVYVPAVKDATSEQIEARNSALGKLLARTVRAKTNFSEAVSNLRSELLSQYQSLLDENQAALQDLSRSLNQRLVDWAHPNATLRLEWWQDPEKSVRVEEPLAHIIAGEGQFEGDLARFGHGLQRSYLLALLHEVASSDEADQPRLILGCEEPELYQHPPQARHLATVLQKLTGNNAQIIVSTHSPLFVSGEGFENVRMVRKDMAKGSSSVAYMSFPDIAQEVANVTGAQPMRSEGVLAKIHQALQPNLSEMFFCSRLVLVEGLEDVAYITAYMNLLELWDEYRRKGCHAVACGKKSEMLQPVILAKRMNIPTCVVFDSDADKLDDKNRELHEKDNKALFTAVGKPNEKPFPGATVWHNGCVVWHSDIGAIVRDEIGADDWQAYRAKADAQYGHAGRLKKNMLHIGASLAFAWADGKRSASLERLCGDILDLEKSI